MAKTDGDPQLYNTLMAHHRCGYALYHPESSLVLKPGVCGYIDGDGDWHHMVDILARVGDPPKGTTGVTKNQDPEITSSSNPKYTAFKLSDPFARKKTSLSGPIFTETVDLHSYGIKAGTVIPAGIPAEAGAIAEFSLMAAFGALLICKGYVTMNSFNDLDPFRKWAKENFGNLLAKFPAIRTCGFYVVTKTWTAKEVFIKSWRNKEHKLNVGFSGGVESVAEIEASTQIYGASRANGWHVPIWEVEGEESVVFLGGLQYKYRTLDGWMRQNKDKFKEGLPGMWRGESDIVQDPEVEDNAVELREIPLDDKGKF